MELRNTAPADNGGRRKKSWVRALVFRLVSLSLSLLASFVVVEIIFRLLEHGEQSQTFTEGPGGAWVADARWGWKPAKGTFRVGTPEFVASGTINELHMNDLPPQPGDEAKTRVLVLGDSHTFAVGVSQHEAWPKRLEHKLNGDDNLPRYRTYNAACPGYSVHQYLLRLADQGPLLKPHYVVAGFSYATDLYDLLPPDRGGWIYGDDKERDYFDLDESGTLVEKHSEPTRASGSESRSLPAVTIRRTLGSFATFRYLRRSNTALWVGSHVKVGGNTLWPNMDVVLEQEIAEKHRYQWELLYALLLRLQKETQKQNARLVIVGIPYLPQVYDEIWNVTFGNNERYSRTAAIERLSAWCQSHDIVYVDTCDAFRTKVSELGRWLHHRKDAHPTAEGQDLIAQVLIDATVLPRRQ
ncbi:MAG: hypothetical protein K2R98_07100 [Gemmataceae bacterium]|nr:hypothetical protein [Gemmataceae bacterium]